MQSILHIPLYLSSYINNQLITHIIFFSCFQRNWTNQFFFYSYIHAKFSRDVTEVLLFPPLCYKKSQNLNFDIYFFRRLCCMYSSTCYYYYYITNWGSMSILYFFPVIFFIILKFKYAYPHNIMEIMIYFRILWTEI